MYVSKNKKINSILTTDLLSNAIVKIKTMVGKRNTFSDHYWVETGELKDGYQKNN